MNYKEIFQDIITHAGDFKGALRMAVKNAEPPGVDHDDPAYWNHQLKTYENIEKLAALMLGKDQFEPVGSTEEERFDSFCDHVSKKMEAVSIFIDVENNKYALKNLNAAELCALAFLDFHAEVCNGGVTQYCSTGSASAGLADHISASLVVARLCNDFQDADKEVAELVREIAHLANRNKEINSYDEREYDRVQEKAEPLETRYYALPNERIYAFFMNVVEQIDPSCRPFLLEIAKREEILSPAP